jgi:glycosyltransferase involved in cell wall biosynthesis/2-polyprenyl-3-methyl-5-hydroxy-6-metoxy-1,4-benzoquinol methylase
LKRSLNVPKIAACMIVKNSAATLEACLDSIRPFVDEINIFDTGSTDGTLDLLEKLGETTTWWATTDGVLHKDKPGDDTEDIEKQPVPLAPIRVKQAGDDMPVMSDGSLADFSWAREQSFAMVDDPEVGWYFWLDDDDIIVGAEHLRMLAYAAHESVDGYLMFYDYAQDEQGNNVCQLWRERLVRRQPGKWLNPVHEVWCPELDRPVNYTAVPPQQVRYVHGRPVVDRYKPTRNLDILMRAADEAKEKGEEPDLRTRAYIGTELMAHGRLDEAVPWFDSYLGDPTCMPSDERSQMFHKLATCLRETGNALAAANVEHEALKERDDWAENAAGLAECYDRLGRPDRVVVWAKRALEIGMPQSVLLINPLEIGFLPLVRLAESYSRLGDAEQALHWVERARQIRPADEFLQALAAGIEQSGQQDEIVGALMLLRETLIRHDENEKAYHLLSNAPYFVQEHPAVVQALAAQTENVRHMLEPEEYTRWYEDEPKESTVTDEQVPVLGDQIERAGFTLELARKFEAEHGRKPRILDLGANDAWMACYLWLEGEFVVDGIELNKASVEKGLARMERFGAPGWLAQGNIYDAWSIACGEENERRRSYGQHDIITCYEVFEHVPDTERLIATMCSLTHDEGFVCITTPNGAYERGNVPMWAQVERKGHLRAVPVGQFTQQLAAHGDLKDVRVHHGDHLTWAALQPKAHRGKVHLFAGGAWEPWSPASIRDGGLGGSETALVQLALGLKDQGYDVRVFTDAEPGVYVGTIWRPAAAWNPAEYADATIVSRIPDAFLAPINSPTRALWCHDHTYEIGRLQGENMTEIVCLSDWHAERTARLHPHLAEKIVVRRNGILTVGYGGDERFEAGNNTFDQRACKAIYSSSADRGLDVLLECWPEIKRLVPEAELDVFYGWDVFDAVARGNPGMWEFKAKVMALAEAAEGVNMRGRVGQPELYEAMSTSRVWAYPTAFLETSCIGAMEARANGLAIVTSDLGALGETVGEHGHLIAWSDDEDERCNETLSYRQQFITTVAALLADRGAWKRHHKSARQDWRELDWRKRCEEWAELIDERSRHGVLGRV